MSQMPLLETHLLQSHRELRLAHLALSTLTMGYVWQEGEKETVKVYITYTFIIRMPCYTYVRADICLEFF